MRIVQKENGPKAICMMDLYDVDFHSPSGFVEAKRFTPGK